MQLKGTKSAKIGVLFWLVMIPFLALADDAIEARERAAGQAAAAFIKELGGALKGQMAKGDPVAAIAVCRDVAPAIANRLSLENGWKVTRVGTRVRNPLLGTPDAWEQQVLAEFEARSSEGVEYTDMKHAETVTEPSGRYFRFMKPISVASACLTCHGGKQSIPKPIQKALEDNYPRDRAVGYQEGELRGAVSIKQPLDMPLTAKEISN